MHLHRRTRCKLTYFHIHSAGDRLHLYYPTLVLSDGVDQEDSPPWELGDRGAMLRCRGVLSRGKTAPSLNRTGHRLGSDHSVDSKKSPQFSPDICQRDGNLDLSGKGILRSMEEATGRTASGCADSAWQCRWDWSFHDSR